MRLPLKSGNINIMQGKFLINTLLLYAFANIANVF